MTRPNYDADLVNALGVVVSTNGMRGALVIKSTTLNVVDNPGDPSVSLELKTASASVVGGVKVGNTLTINGSGVLDVKAVSPTIASASVLGSIRVGTGLAIDGSGILSATATGYTLPVATSSVLGGVKQGTGVTIAGDGTLNNAYSLPIASASVLGGMKVGSGLAIDGAGVLSATATGYTLPVATSSVLGGVKQGTGVTVAGDGTLSLPAQPYDWNMYYKGAPTGGTIMARLNIAKAVTLPQNLTGSYATAEIAATASTVLRIVRNTTDIGTITFAAGATVGTFTFSAAVTFTPGDKLYVYNAASADATLADISITLAGTR